MAIHCVLTVWRCIVCMVYGCNRWERDEVWQYVRERGKGWGWEERERERESTGQHTVQAHTKFNLHYKILSLLQATSHTHTHTWTLLSHYPLPLLLCSNSNVNYVLSSKQKWPRKPTTNSHTTNTSTVQLMNILIHRRPRPLCLIPLFFWNPSHRHHCTHKTKTLLLRRFIRTQLISVSANYMPCHTRYILSVCSNYSPFSFSFLCV